jgi:hypothetical protein
MKSITLGIVTVCVLSVFIWVGVAAQNGPSTASTPLGQEMQHTPGMQHPAGAAPTEGGQAAFAAIGEIVKLLEADHSTDWSKVNLEALRQHLIDMDLVTLRARVTTRAVDGGLAMDVTGDTAVEAAITRMLVSHATMLDAMPAWRATTTPIAGGVRLTVTVRNADDAGTLAKIRGLGFAGLLVQGDHHTTHHLALARGVDIHRH